MVSEVGGGGGTIYPGVKCPPSQPSCMLTFLCNDKRDWEEPGHLKFLNALQEYTENNFSYIVPKNIVNSEGGGGGGGERDNLTQGKVPPPPINPHVCFHFYVMIKGIETSLVIWSFWMPFKSILKTISHISSLRTTSIAKGVGAGRQKSTTG